MIVPENSNARHTLRSVGRFKARESGDQAAWDTDSASSEL
jgi:hypothetical protein